MYIFIKSAIIIYTYTHIMHSMAFRHYSVWWPINKNIERATAAGHGCTWQQNRCCPVDLNDVTTDKHGKAFCILGVACCVSMCRPHRLYEIYYVLLYGVNKRNLLLSHSYILSLTFSVYCWLGCAVLREMGQKRMWMLFKGIKAPANRQRN